MKKKYNKNGKNIVFLGLFFLIFTSLLSNITPENNEIQPDIETIQEQKDDFVEDEKSIINEADTDELISDVEKKQSILVQIKTENTPAKLWPPETIEPPFAEPLLSPPVNPLSNQIVSVIDDFDKDDTFTQIEGLPTQTPINTPTSNQTISAVDDTEIIEKENINEETQIDEPRMQQVPTVQEVKPQTQENVKNNQFIEITYPGSGWIYIGEEGSENFVSYVGRKTLDGNTVFTIKTQKPGLTRLEFYKSDPLSQSYLEDRIDLIIAEESALNSEIGTIDSYTYSDALKAPVQRSVNRVSENDSTFLINEPELEIIQELQSFESIPSEMLLEIAKDAIENSDYSNAIDYLDEFLRSSLEDTDEAWFLRGQLYEKPGTLRNIRLAQESYQTIVDVYPSSSFYKQAQDRIMYIDKFFFTIQ